MNKIIFTFYLLIGIWIFLLPKVTLAQSSEPDMIVFSGGNWENGIVGSGMWKWVPTDMLANMNRVSDVVRQGNYSLRVSLPPTVGRSEVSIPSKPDGSYIFENSSTDYEYVGFSVRLDPSWQGGAVGDKWQIVAQLHGPDLIGESPAWSLHAENSFYVEMTAGDMDHPTWPDYPLSNGNLNKGHWVDFIVKLVYSETDGSYTLWRRDEGESDFVIVSEKNHVPTLQYKTSYPLPPYDSKNPTNTNHYWKHGLYRDPILAYTSTLWLDGFTIGKSFNIVKNTAFPAVSTPIPTATPGKVGDLNNDKVVDIRDFIILSGDFGDMGAGLSSDLNNDQVVNIQDFIILSNNF